MVGLPGDNQSGRMSRSRKVPGFIVPMEHWSKGVGRQGSIFITATGMETWIDGTVRQASRKYWIAALQGCFKISRIRPFYPAVTGLFLKICTTGQEFEKVLPLSFYVRIGDPGGVGE
jgi:hypothetical protein